LKRRKLIREVVVKKKLKFSQVGMEFSRTIEELLAVPQSSSSKAKLLGPLEVKRILN